MNLNQLSKVAVVITIYNAEKTLRRTLESLKAQTYTNWEAVCVFNKCTDGSKDVMDQFLKEHIDQVYKFHITDCSAEQGHVPASNTGMIYALSIPNVTHIARLDSDDAWYPEKLQKQVDYLQSNGAVDILGAQMRLIQRDSGKVIGLTNHPLDDKTIKANMLTGQNPIANSTAIFKKEVVLRTGLYDDLFSLSEDFWFWLKASKWYTFANLEEVLCDYTSWANPNYTPLSPQLAAYCAGMIKEHFPGKR
jgi:glycosyltransferase involved in cell wall biosynthesis